MQIRPLHGLVLVIVLLVAVAALRSVAIEEGSGNASPASTESTGAGLTTIEPATTAPPTTLPQGVSLCETYGEPLVTGTVADDGVNEASGLAASRVFDDLLWTHNDSRAGAVVYAIALDGSDRGRLALEGVVAFDWEDIAVGPGPEQGRSYLYLGDIGDNFGIRDGDIDVYRVAEPSGPELPDALDDVATLSFRYPDGPHNAEAMLVDPVDRHLYVITKEEGEARVYRADPTAADAGTVTAELAAVLHLGAPVTGADITPDGSLIALRGYNEVWLWERGAAVGLAEALAAAPCEAPSPTERQAEAIALLPDGSYVTLSEGSHPDVNLVPRLSS